jgi:hypothetical protein
MMINSYHFDKTPEDAQRETPVGEFSEVSPIAHWQMRH